MKIVKWLDEYLEEVLLTLLLFGIAIVMILQVIFRYVFNYSLSWSDELTRYFLVWSCFLSVSYCVKKRISIKIDQFQNMVPKRGIPWIKMIRHTIVFIFCIIMIPFSVTYVKQAAASGATSAALQIPMVFIQSAPLIGFLLLAIRVAEAWWREFQASRGVMVESISDSLKAEPLEEIKEKEAEEEQKLKEAGFQAMEEVNESDRIKEIIQDNVPDGIREELFESPADDAAKQDDWKGGDAE